MELASVRGLSELGIEDPSFANHWLMNSLDELSMLPLGAASSENNLTARPRFETPHVPNAWFNPSEIGFHAPAQHRPPASLFSALARPKEEEASVVDASRGVFGRQNQAARGERNSNKRVSPSRDHIMAERKRREKLSQRFIALSAIVPGLKKMDKASVLGDAIKYMKQLQEKVKALEEQNRNKKSMETVVFVKKSQLICDGNFSDEPLPEIEARVCDKNVLIRIHCERRKGVLEKTIGELEKLSLSVISSSCMTFGNSALDLTIIAQMNLEFSLTMQDVVKNLRQAFTLFK